MSEEITDPNQLPSKPMQYQVGEMDTATFGRMLHQRSEGEFPEPPAEITFEYVNQINTYLAEMEPGDRGELLIEAMTLYPECFRQGRLIQGD